MNSSTHLYIFSQSEKTIEALSLWWQEETSRLSHLHSPVSWALSGGKTPLGLYQKLAQNDSIPWSSLQVFLVDERDVEIDHPDSNYRLCQEAGLGKRLSRQQFPSMREAPLCVALSQYEQEIRALPHSKLDLVLLGMGADGHTASLFPGTQEGDKALTKESLSHGPYVITHELPHQPLASLSSKWRISLTYKTLVEAREVAFLITGKDKASRLLEIFTQSDSNVPCAKLWRYRKSLGLSTRWYLDEDSASLLPQNKAL